MKKTLLTILCAALLVGHSTTSFAAQDQKDNKPQFREETMRKFAIDNVTVQLNKGTVWIYDYPEQRTKVHAYETKDFFGSFVYLIEKEGKAVLVETPPIKDNYAELIEYINKLGYKNISVISSYHPIGATFFDTKKLDIANIYSMKHAVDFYATGEGAPSLVGLKRRFGEQFDETIIKPTVLLDEGEVEIDGITFVLKNADIAFDVAMPEIDAVHPHILGHDKHSLIFSLAFLDAYIAQLERYQEQDYDIIFSSHSEPESKGDVTIKLNYLRNMKRIVAESGSKTEFIQNMQSAYPNFGWPFYLQGSANFLFKNN